MDERGKIELIEQTLTAWNRGDLEWVTTRMTADHEWDLTRSDIPGESEIHRGPAGYLRFIERWREVLGPTQVELEEAVELPDGRLFQVIRQLGAGVRSGANVEIHYVQITSFEGKKLTGAEVFTDERKGRVAAGLPPNHASNSEESNLVIARRGFELWNEGGVEAMVEHVWASDIVFHEIPELPDSSVYRGAEALAAHLRELIDVGGHFQLEVRSLEASGPYVLASLQMSMKGAGGGVPLTEPLFHVSRYEEGKLCELHSYLDRDQARTEYERLSVSPG